MISLFLHLALANDVFLCFYEGPNEEFCPMVNASLIGGVFYNISYQNFDDYKTKSYDDADIIFITSVDNMPDGKELDISVFSKKNPELIISGNLTRKNFFITLENSDVSTYVKSISLTALSIHFKGKGAEGIKFSDIHLADTTFNLNGTLVCTKLDSDLLSLESVTRVEAQRTILHYFYYEPIDEIRMSIASNEVAITDFDYAITVSIMNQFILLSLGKGMSSFGIQFENITTAIDIQHIMPLIPITIECLSYSKAHQPPHINVTGCGIYFLTKSSWPNASEPLITFNRVQYTVVDINDYVPVDFPYSNVFLTIIPSGNSGIIGNLEIKNKEVEIAAASIVPTYFYVRNLIALSNDFILNAFNPIQYVTIDNIQYQKGNETWLNFNGTSFWVFKQIPNDPLLTLNVSVLWLPINSTYYPALTLESTANIVVNNKVKTENPPTIFQPYIAKIPTEEEIKNAQGKKFNFICAKHLKCYKENLSLPYTDVRGFSKGVSILEPFCDEEVHPTCFGVQIVKDLSKIGSKFCLADDSTKCPNNTIADSEWSTYENENADELQFTIINQAPSFIFGKYNQTCVKLFGVENAKATINLENVSKLNAEFVDLQINSIISIPVAFNGCTFSSAPQWSGNSSIEVDHYTYKQLKDFNCSSLNITGLSHTKLELGDQKIVLSGGTEQEDLTIDAQPNLSLIFSTNKLEISTSSKNMIPVSILLPDNATVSIVGEWGTEYDGITINKFNGELDVSSANVPIKFIDASNLHIKSSAKSISILNSVEISNSLSVSEEVQSLTTKQLILHNAIVPNACSVTTQLLSVNGIITNKISSANIDTMQLSKSTQISFGDLSAKEINIDFNFNEFPEVTVDSFKTSDTNVTIYYTGHAFPFKIKENAVAYNNSKLILIKGKEMKCGSFTTNFVSDILEFDDIYTILFTYCEENNLYLGVNESSVPTPTPPPPSTKTPYTKTSGSNNMSAVIGSCIGGVIFIFLVVLVFCCMNKKKKYVPKDDAVVLQTTLADERDSLDPTPLIE